MAQKTGENGAKRAFFDYFDVVLTYIGVLGPIAPVFCYEIGDLECFFSGKNSAFLCKFPTFLIVFFFLSYNRGKKKNYM
jgi:hypothetical protein